MTRLKQSLLIIVAVIIGFIASTPTLFLGGFGIPADMDSPYAVQWLTVMLLAVSPFFLGFLALIFMLIGKGQKLIKWLCIAAIALPFCTSIYTLQMIFGGDENAAPTTQSQNLQIEE